MIWDMCQVEGTKTIDEKGHEYYKWILCYVDDLLVISHDPQSFMEKLSESHDLKDTVHPPEQYLGANISRWHLPDGQEGWAMSEKEYVKIAIKLVKEILKEKGLQLLTGKATRQPMAKDYRPELDISLELGKNNTSIEQQVIGDKSLVC